MVVYLLDRISDEIITHKGVKMVRIVTDAHDVYWIELVFRTKNERYPVKYFSVFQVRQ